MWKTFTEKKIATLSQTGFIGIGGGLYLRISPKGKKRWYFVYQWEKKRVDFPLGSYPTLNLARAGDLAFEARHLLNKGINPYPKNIAQHMHNAQLAESSPHVVSVPTPLAFAPSHTFRKVMERFIGLHSGAWRNAKHRQQWENTLKTYAAPLMEQDVDAITINDIVTCLAPIWTDKQETASRVRARIQRILDAAIVQGFRKSRNPAKWDEALKFLLPKQDYTKKGHHAALAYPELPQFFAELQKRSGCSARSLEFLILTVTRSGEVRGATWEEIDALHHVWILPKDRMKAKREHRIPLTQRCIQILKGQKRAEQSADDRIFSSESGKMQSDSVWAALFKRMNLPYKITAHGFR